MDNDNEGYSFWDVTPCGSCKNRLSEERIANYTADLVLSSLIQSTLMMEAIRSSETSILTRVMRCHITVTAVTT
jgi:hypothetical protein